MVDEEAGDIRLLEEAAALLGDVVTWRDDGRTLGTMDILTGMSVRFREELKEEQSSPRVGSTKLDFDEISSLARRLAVKLKALETNKYQSALLLREQYKHSGSCVLVPWDLGMPREAVCLWLEGGRPDVRQAAISPRTTRDSCRDRA